jgi:transcriptional regulator with XRE-family HTH domain
MGWNYARAIRLVRASLNITQAELGRRCGVHDSAVSRYESHSRNPTIEKLPLIFEALGCTPQEMIALAEDWEATSPTADERARLICRVLLRPDAATPVNNEDGS